VELEISMQHTFQGEPLLLDSIRYETAAKETISLTRLSYLLSGFAVEREDGKWEEIPAAYAWIDLRSRRTSFRIRDLPDGKFRAIRFSIGPDPAANAADVSKIPAEHPLNPALNGLHWSWQGGYIFMALEGYFRGNGEPSGFSYHLARDPFRTCISLTIPLDLRQNAALAIHFDLANLLNAPRGISFENDGSATHSRDGDPIATALVANLPGAFRVSQVLAASANPLPSVEPLYLPTHFTPYRFRVSRSFPIPDLSRDNPLMEERIALGAKLFNDPALSRDASISCATCHQADAAFTDRLPLSRGIDGQIGERNAMPLFNLAWKKEFFWDGRAPSLRSQVLAPIEDHREMGTSLEQVCAALAARPDYQAMFRAAFAPVDITPEKIALALEQFLLTLSARDSKFDRAIAGKMTLSDPEKRGFELFMTEYDPRTGQLGADCFHCHGGALFSDFQFHNNGLAGTDAGRSAVTHSPGDLGKFATPSLRNVALTAPYMHDGRFATLEEVVAHYSSGIQRSPTLDPNLAKHPNNGLHLSTADQAALVAFLKTLSVEAP
jgi:cytochrome c peroxidase